MCTSLISKYNVAGPRYTSYPTVPYWDNSSFSLNQWEQSIRKSFENSNNSEGISLYIHLPFCESMCTFCGCSKRITKNHSVETPYIKSVIKEFRMYRALFKQKPIIKQLHLGGGTPTFFSPKNLKLLLDGIFSIAKKAKNTEFSFEGHPNNTNKIHLKTLANFGFSRVCYGVQDYNLKVQKAINRIQPFENVQRVSQDAREIGYSSVGHDIIYGLPFQTIEDVINTVTKTINILPDRIAFYSYAHVPWIKGNGQRGYNDADLPSPQKKSAQYALGKEMLLDAGYSEIGMDHFALPTDSLHKSQERKTIHRNFMGYSSSKTELMIGLGASAIGDSWYGFAQNVKNVDEYQKLINEGLLPLFRGHILTQEDLIIRKHILNLMCTFETSWKTEDTYFNELPEVLIKLKELENDGLIEFGQKKLIITEKGKPFVRNVCLPFDLRLQRNKPETQVFSMTV